MSETDRPDPHAVNERARLISRAVYASEIEQRPALVEQAAGLVRAKIAHDGGNEADQAWLDTLSMPFEKLKARMHSDCLDDWLLRSNSPLSIFVGVRDVERRRAILASGAS